MIDFHNHVLPGVDDGAKTLEESIEMLRFATKQGITEVVQTVHFQHPKMDGKNVNYDYLKDRIDEVQYEINKHELNIKMHLAAEVFYLPNLLKIIHNPLVTIGKKKKFMLIEFKSNIFPTGFEEEFYKLQLNGVTPIVAHPERYRFIQNDFHIMKNWIERGYVMQIDAGSIIGNFGKSTQRISFDIIDNSYFHLIGSDAHNSYKRNFCLKDAYDFLEKKYSLNLINQLKKNVENIINGSKVSNIKLYKNMPSFMKSKIFKLFHI